MALVTITPGVAGQVLTAAFYNNNLNAILNQVNGNIEAINIKDNTITGAKLATGAVDLAGTKITGKLDLTTNASFGSSQATGDIIYAASASALARLAAGTAWQSLHLRGTADAPIWGAGIVQVQYASVTSLVSCTTTMPSDDTIPQNTEGNEIVTVTITPKATENRLVIFIGTMFEHDTSGGGANFALFQDSTANALKAWHSHIPINNGHPIFGAHEMAAGTTSPTTFKLRGGADQGGVTLRVNGDTSGNRLFGGVAPTFIMVVEYVN